MLHNIKPLPLHCVFHGIRFKVNEDWESGKIPFFYFCLLDRRTEEHIELKVKSVFLFLCLKKSPTLLLDHLVKPLVKQRPHHHVNHEHQRVVHILYGRDGKRTEAS